MVLNDDLVLTAQKCEECGALDLAGIVFAQDEPDWLPGE